jgi:hypothetical protein
MINYHTQATRWAIAGITALIGAILAAAGSEAWGIPARVVTLESNDKSNHELLLEQRDDIKDMRQDIKELMRRP